MKFAIRFDSGQGPVSDCVELARLAERVGFDSVWYSEDLFMRDAWIALTAIAANTKNVRIGTAIVNPFSSSPAELAMRAGSLQEFSGGRFMLGIGPGATETLDSIGLRPRRPVQGLRESIYIIRRLLGNETAEYEGKVFKGYTEQAKLRFESDPHRIPIYIGGQGPRALRLMGELGDGALPLLFPPENADNVVAEIGRGAREAGRKPENIEISGLIWFWASDGSASPDSDMSLKWLIANFGYMLRDEVLSTVGLRKADFAGIRKAMESHDVERACDMVEKDMLRLAITGSFGDAEGIAKRIERLERIGIDQVNIGPPFGPDPAESIRFLGKSVIPAFAGQAR